MYSKILPVSHKMSKKLKFLSRTKSTRDNFLQRIESNFNRIVKTCFRFGVKVFSYYPPTRKGKGEVANLPEMKEYIKTEFDLFHS